MWLWAVALSVCFVSALSFSLWKSTHFLETPLYILTPALRQLALFLRADHSKQYRQLCQAAIWQKKVLCHFICSHNSNHFFKDRFRATEQLNWVIESSQLQGTLVDFLCDFRVIGDVIGFCWKYRIFNGRKGDFWTPLYVWFLYLHLYSFPVSKALLFS